MFKILSAYICWKKYIKCNIWRVAVRPSYIQDARFLKVNELTSFQLVKIPRILWNPKVRYSIHKFLQPVPYPEPARSSPYPHILLPEDPSFLTNFQLTVLKVTTAGRFMLSLNIYIIKQLRRMRKCKFQENFKFFLYKFWQDK